MAQETDRAELKAVVLNDGDLDQAQGGFTPTTGADKMEFSSPGGSVPKSEFTPTTGADKMEFSVSNRGGWLF